MPQVELRKGDEERLKVEGEKRVKGELTEEIEVGKRS